MTLESCVEPLDRPRVVHVHAVVGALAELLTRFGHPDRAVWLRSRLAVLEDATATTDDTAAAVSEMHNVVLGMGGLLDLHLSGTSASETDAANAELERLADQLFELTR